MNEVLDIAALSESVNLECKAAQGRDGKGELPASFWETYSAMANSNGGEIYLGIEETTPGRFDVVGIKDIDRVKKSLWDALHAKNKVSKNYPQRFRCERRYHRCKAGYSHYYS
jgi:ATP-dependent DNA helicase RecG